VADRTWTDDDLRLVWTVAHDAGRLAAESNDAAYRAGFHDGRRYALSKVGELDRVWRPVARRTEAERIAAHVAEMESYAARRGRGTYPGGPVDWVTGKPVRQREAVAA
jgi:hypothetical protein